MASVAGHGPSPVKREGTPTTAIKAEISDVDMDSAGEEEDGGFEDNPNDALSFDESQRSIWLSRIPRSLWESLASLKDDDEIELGAIRIEGPEDNPSRISLHLNDLPQLYAHHKSFNLQPPPQDRRKLDVPLSTYIFSEADLPGYKPKTFSWDAIDEEGNPGQGRSYLFERQKRDQKRKEDRQNNEFKRFVPYSRRGIPKRTALRGQITREYEAVAATDDPNYRRIEKIQQEALLAQPKKTTTEIMAPGSMATRITNPPLMTTKQRQEQNRLIQQRRQQQKDNRTARVDHNVLIDNLLNAFKIHRIWGLRSLRERLEQPEAYLKEVLSEIAFMHRHGDWSGKWELKEEYKQTNSEYLKPRDGDVAPKEEGMSDVDVETKSGIDTGGESEGFEDA